MSTPPTPPSRPPTPPSRPPPPPRTSTLPAIAVPVAFLGTGAMGTPMAANVARKGFPLQVWNRHHERAHTLTALGGKVRSTPAECAFGARIIVTMLRDEAALLSVLGRPDGVLAGLSPDAVVVDMSTIGRAGALKAAAMVKDAGGRFVDAPVIGSVGSAERGDLIALGGGRLNDVSRAQPVILAMCKRMLHAGDVGHGQALKMLVNGVGLHQAIAYASMLVLGERAGIARRTIIEALSLGSSASPAFVAKKDKLLAKDYSPEYTLDFTLKDALLNVDLQQEVGLPLPVVHEALRALEQAVDEGLGPEDLFALEKYYRDL